MQLRQSARLLAVAGALVLAAPVLTSCGFDYATDRDYTPAAGVNDRDATVDVLGAVVVSAEANSGTFIASFANNLQDQDATVTSIAGAGDDAALKFADFEPIEIPAGGLVNLATDDQGIEVTGTFEAGYSIDLTITTGDGQTIDMTVPTVANCNEYAGLDQSADADSAAAAEQCVAETAGPAEH